MMAQLETTGTSQTGSDVVAVGEGAGARFALPPREWAVRLVTTLALVAAGILAYTLPAVTLNDGQTLDIQEVHNRLTFDGYGWILPLSWFAGAVALISTVAFPLRERFIQTVAISAGALAALTFPLYVATHLDRVDEQADGLGTGLIGASAALVVSAALPWLSVLVLNRTKPVFGRDWSKWLFLLPAVVWILLLTIFPLIYAFTTSRYAFRNGRLSQFVGWENYRRLFDVTDPARTLGLGLLVLLGTAAIVILAGLGLRWLSERELSAADLRSVASIAPVIAVPVTLVYLAEPLLDDPLGTQLSVTFFFVFVSVAIEMVLGFLIALLMNREIRGEGVLRAIMTLPIFATPIALGYLFRTIFYEEGGPVNAFLANFGLQPPWLSDPDWARFATIIVDVWQWTPFVFIIALAGLQGLPQDVTEASAVDGATGWQSLRYVVLPMMAPILWLILLLRMIDAFKVFDIPQGLTLGGPGRATEYYSLFTYRTARKFFDYGSAAAQAFLLLVIVMVIVTLLWGRIRHLYEEERGRP